MSTAPLFSVIVVCKNPGAKLPVALASVWSQREASLELIVIDGASTDGTREWLQARRVQIAVLVSEPDRGVYDAMNKGIARARGEWIYFLGADDRLAEAAVLATVSRHARDTKAGVLAGEAMFADGRVYRFRPESDPAARNFLHHQAAFYRRTLFAAHGEFDATLRVMADYDFNVRLRRRGVEFAPMGVRIAVCGTGGMSDAGSWRGYREEIAVRHRHFSPLRCLAWDVGSVVRWLRKKFVRRISRVPFAQ